MTKIREISQVENPEFALCEGQRLFVSNDQPPLYAITTIDAYGTERWVKASGPYAEAALPSVFDETTTYKALEALQEIDPATRGWNLSWDDGLILSGEYPGGDDLLTRNMAALALGAGLPIA